jgi:phage shock protein A
MTDDAKRRLDTATKRAAALIERQKDSERRVADEEKRHRDMRAKTARLRKERLARDAVEPTVVKTEGKAKKQGPGRG